MALTKVTYAMIEGDPINILDYGADPTGVADSTAAINNALAAGSYVVMPANSTFLVTSTIYIGENKTLAGGGHTTIINGSGISGPIVCLGVLAGTLTNNGVAKDFRISGTATEGLRVNNNITCLVSNVALLSFTGTNGFVFYNTYGSTFSYLRTNGSTISNACFYFGQSFSANFCSNLYTGSNFCAVNFLMDETYPSVTSFSHGNNFSMLTAQCGDIGLHFRQFRASVVNGYYTENVGLPLKFGDVAASRAAFNCVVNGGELDGPLNTNGFYASRYACVDFNLCYHCGVDSVNFTGSFQVTINGAMTVTDGTGSGAILLARLKNDGTVHSVVVLRGGTGYSASPTIALTQGGGTTFTATVVAGVITAVAVTNAGSGLTVAGCPYTISYTNSTASFVRDSYLRTTIGIYNLFMRNAGASTGSSVNIAGDVSLINQGDGGYVDIRKTIGYGYNHVIIDYDAAGALKSTLYVPPQI